MKGRVPLLAALLAGCASHAHEPAPVALRPVPVEPAPESPAAPELGYRVDDRAGLLSPQTRAALQIRLVELSVDTGVSCSVLVVPKAEPLSAEELAVQTAARNKIGGVLILLAVQERELKVSIGPSAQSAFEGKDLNAALDAAAGPHLAEENYATALTQAIRAVETAVRAK